MKTIVFVGAGSMAQAMIHGWMKEDTVSPDDVYVMNKSDRAKLSSLKETYGVNLVCEEKEIVKKADLVILAMKPKDVQAGMETIAPLLPSNAVVLSVLAGVPMETIEQGLGKRPIARCMPNTSANVGMSASAVAWNNQIQNDEKKEILHLLQAIGIVKEVEEEQLHVVTALSGSGPAYIYYFVEAFESAAILGGLSSKVARELLVQTLAGSAEMLKQSIEPPANLREKVTSPGGTTEAGIQSLQQNGFTEILAECLKAAEARSRELGKLYL
ncbi:pyrroline-5-carboxylate reductase [Paenisporosarcina indica]|uniref:pyrroline-5-carboxylate reductase n=1 Tax=Paenisporosarcina indica TaxID=650093 RepID=UPI00094FF181|nr:pyrroline-5-carboxylate reductase [Paenisporosarcina indica]